MRGLNSKEKQGQINRLWFVAGWFSIPRDLVDTLFFNHKYGQYHMNALSAFSLIVFGPFLLWIAFASSRWVQKLSALLLAICCLTALYTRNVSLEIPNNQHLLKELIALWVVAVVIGLADWLFLQRYWRGSGKSLPFDIDTLPILDVFSSPSDSPEDKARSHIFARLRDQARAEGFDLTEIDWMMINYSRIASTNVAGPVEEIFYSTRDYWTFREKIIHLLENAIRDDTDRDGSAMKHYRQLKKDLRKGGRDQQLVAYLATAILEARTQARKALEFSIYAAVGCGVVAAVFFVAQYYK